MKYVEKYKELFLYLFAFMFIFFLVSISIIKNSLIYAEIDSYVLPTISLEYRASLVMNESDLQLARRDYPNLYSNIYHFDDLRCSKLRITEDGTWASYYFPIYSIVCLPVKIILQLFHMNQEFTFLITNAILILMLLFSVIRLKEFSYFQKWSVVLLLIASPVFLYIRYISAETMIYSFVGLGALQTWKKKYKSAAIYISLAGMANSTVMVIGMFLILDYYLHRILNNKKKIRDFIKEEIIKSIHLAICFTPCFAPFIFNRVHQVLGFGIQKESFDWNEYWGRIWAYYFDWNLGFLSFAGVLLFFFFAVMIFGIKKKNYRIVFWIGSLMGTISAFSLMMHINCGMLYSARYIFWLYPILVLGSICVGEELINKFISAKLVIVCSIIISSGMIFINTNTWYNHVTFNQISSFILENCPALYNPLPSTFNSRLNHIDGGYGFETPLIYTNRNGEIKKICCILQDEEKLLKQIVGDKENIEWLQKRISKIDNGKLTYINVPDDILLLQANEYKIGDMIYFHSDMRNAEKYVINGVSSPENGFAWTDGKILKMRMKLESEFIGEDLQAVVDISSIFEGKQWVKAYVNGEQVYDEEVNGSALKFDFCGAEILEIEMKFPNAISPKELNLSEDSRILALALDKMYILRQ